MQLYHGTNLEIENIDLNQCRPYKDFGMGFYLTEMKEQAIKMAHRVSRIYGGNPIVNVYEIPDDIFNAEGLHVRDFGNEVSEEWAIFVMNNRNREFTDIHSLECNTDNKYDIVIGPIADDDMAMLFRQYRNEWIDFETLMKGMTYKSTTNQYSFHSSKALQLLQKVGVLHE